MTDFETYCIIYYEATEDEMASDNSGNYYNSGVQFARTIWEITQIPCGYTKYNFEVFVNRISNGGKFYFNKSQDREYLDRWTEIAYEIWYDRF